jgi:branched-chain amino acid transport system permease protein
MTGAVVRPLPDPHAFLARRARWSAPEILFWLSTLLPFWLFPDYLSLASQIAVWALFAISVDLILGYAGIVTLGHAVFFGIGAYTAGLLGKHGWGEPLSGLLIAATAAAAVGLLVSFFVVRARHLALLMITIGIVFMAREAANALHWITGGSDGLQGIRIDPVLGRFEFDLWGTTADGYSLAVLFVAFVFCRRLVNSPFGLALQGIRENPTRMLAIGSPMRWRLQQVFTFSAGLAGLAGAVLAQTTETVSLEALGFQRSADVVIMLILGGTGRLYGGILGAVIFLVARDQLSDVNPRYWYFWIGMLLIGVVLFMRDGLLGGLSRLWDRVRGRGA